MMVADVDVVEPLTHRGNHCGVTVSQVEDPPVAMAVPVPPTRVGIPEAGALPFADYEVDADRLQGPGLSPVDVSGEGLDRLLTSA